jgi:dCTP diphosphatase
VAQRDNIQVVTEPTKKPSIDDVRYKLRRFIEERDWDKFHSPKNLAISISLEAAEILEHYQWKTDEQSHDLSEEEKEELAREIADVFIYLLRLSERLQIDMCESAVNKIEENAKKYPVEKSRGRSTKYTKL